MMLVAKNYFSQLSSFREQKKNIYRLFQAICQEFSKNLENEMYARCLHYFVF